MGPFDPQRGPWSQWRHRCLPWFQQGQMTGPSAMKPSWRWRHKSVSSERNGRSRSRHTRHQRDSGMIPRRPIVQETLRYRRGLEANAKHVRRPSIYCPPPAATLPRGLLVMPCECDWKAWFGAGELPRLAHSLYLRCRHSRCSPPHLLPACAATNRRAPIQLSRPSACTILWPLDGAPLKRSSIACTARWVGIFNWFALMHTLFHVAGFPSSWATSRFLGAFSKRSLTT